jgi:hypothetical protein
VRHLDEVAEDARIQGLVSETPLADRDARDARIDRDRHAAVLEETRRKIAALLAERDDLLDRLLE